jgi:hypothetical protein
MDLTQTACTMAPVRQGAFIFYVDRLANRSTTSRFAACSGEMQGQYWMVRQAGCARRGWGRNRLARCRFSRKLYKAGLD